jgi:transcriptional regulator with XRE-family HTH domain
MYRPEDLGRRLVELRQARGLSAYAVSKRAGLSTNYLRLVERGVNRPSGSALHAIAHVLELDAAIETDLRRLAGVDPDPTATPEARSERRDAWPILVYVLANHLLLPRLELTKTLARKSARTRNLVQTLRTAAEAADVIACCTALADSTRMPGGLAPLVEQHFGNVTPDTLRPIRDQVSSYVRLATTLGVPTLSYPDKALAALTLTPGRMAPANERGVFDELYGWTFDRSFALAIFPALYWEACRTWPFEKISMRLARRTEQQQRYIYDAVRGGLDLIGLDELLLGRGELGGSIAKAEPARPSPDLLHELDQQQVSAFFQPVTRGPVYEGPVPPTDAVFDHLDRCGFLDRFPFIKIDQASFIELGRSFELPSWRTWADHVRAYVKDLPRDAAVLGEQRFARVLDTEPVRWQATESFIVEWITEAFRAAAQAAAEQGKWGSLVQAGDILNLDHDVHAFVKAFAQRAPDADRR